MTDADQAAFIDLFSEQAHVYDTGVDFFGPLAEQLVTDAEVGPGQDVLDIGCGRGAVVFRAAERVGPTGSVTGIDLAEGMVDATARDVTERGLDHVTVRVGDGAAPEFGADTFDRVLGSMSIIFIQDLVRAFGSYHALLREGGLLGFTAPALGADPTEWRMGPFDIPRMIDEAVPAQRRAELERMREGFTSLRPERLLGDLRAGGFEHPVARPATITITGSSGREFVDWTFTHGMRTFWMLLDESTRASYAAELAARIDAERGKNPTISYPVRTLTYRARK